jgi:hypothetical protein
MPNENCLKGIKCPQCGSDEAFGIACDVVYEITDDGTGDQLTDGHEWDETSYCECRNCFKSGTVADFRVNHVEVGMRKLRTLMTEYSRLMEDREKSMEDENIPCVEDIDESIDSVREDVFDVVAEMIAMAEE